MTAVPRLRVLDLSGPAAAFAARLCAGLGADVIRVEPAAAPTSGGDAADRRRSRLRWQAGKRLTCLDPERDVDRDRLAGEADVRRGAGRPRPRRGRRAARSFYVDVEHPAAGIFPHEGVVPRLSRTPGRIAAPAPRLGEHTTEALTALAGLDPAELAGLQDASVLA